MFLDRVSMEQAEAKKLMTTDRPSEVALEGTSPYDILNLFSYKGRGLETGHRAFFFRQLYLGVV